jgi:hypothetical protein
MFLISESALAADVGRVFADTRLTPGTVAIDCRREGDLDCMELADVFRPQRHWRTVPSTVLRVHLIETSVR